MSAPLVVIVGPTAIGKTTISVAIAKRLNAVVISGDAFQLYKHLDIATAKVTKTERQGVEHRLIDVLEPDEPISAATYQRMVRVEIDRFLKQGVPVVLSGGSGLYVQSVLFDYRFPGDARDDKFERSFDGFANDELYKRLQEIDPMRASTIDIGNRRRLLRALQIVTESSLEGTNSRSRLLYPDAVMIALEAPRNLLYDRINRRVDQMVAMGLVEEARMVYQNHSNSQASAAIGYKELVPYFQGVASLDECLEQIKLHSRRYAKRQLTWFHNQMNLTWFTVDFEQLEAIVDKIFHYVQGATTVDN